MNAAPTREPLIFVGTVGEGLWRSADGGQSWQRLKNGLLSECDVRAIAINPTNARQVVVGTNEGIFLSNNSGDAFERCAGEHQETTVWSLAIDLRDSKRMLAGARPARVFASHDSGRTWRRLPAPIDEASDNPALRYNRVTFVGFDPRDATRIWVGVEIGGVFASADDGETWRRCAAGLSSLDIHGLVVLPEPGGARLVVSTDNDLNVSTDDGANWTPLDAAKTFPQRYCRVLAQCTRLPGRLYLGNGDGPPGSVGAGLRSEDGGRTWREMPFPTTLNSTLWGYATHRGDPNRMYAATVSGQLFQSLDAGDSWTKLPREFGEIRAVAWAPA